MNCHNNNKCDVLIYSEIPTIQKIKRDIIVMYCNIIGELFTVSPQGETISGFILMIDRNMRQCILITM